MAFLQRTMNRGSVSTGYEIEYSNKFESDKSEGIIRNYDASTGANCIANNSTTNAKKFTVSYWVKKTELLASGQNIPWIAIAGGNATVVKFQDENFAAYDDSAGWSLTTNAVFRDTSAWYHLVCAVDTTQSTASDRVNLYVNGVLQTSFSTENYGTQNNDNQLWKVNTGHMIGSSSYFKGGYIAEVHCIDGTQYAASDFGEYDADSGIWIPKEADVTYGDQGYYLNWSDFGSANSNANNTGVGKDHSGNTNPFVNLGNWSSADIATDTPTNNFATLNPLGENHGSAVISDGATKIDGSGSTTEEAVYSSICVTSGKWYAEVTPQLGSFNTNFGIVNIDTATFDGTAYNNAGYWLGNFDSGAVIYYYANGSGAGTSTVNFSTGDVIGLALDLDNNTLDFYVNGSQNKQMTSLPSGTYGFIADVQGTGGPYIQYNFGGYTLNTISSAASDANGYGTFEHAPPSGYYALCGKNLAEYGG